MCIVLDWIFMSFSWFSPLILWLLTVQNISDSSVPFLVTVNPPHPPKNVLLKWSTGHLTPSVAAVKAACEFNMLQGKRRIWFSEAYHGKLNKKFWNLLHGLYTLLLIHEG